MSTEGMTTATASSSLNVVRLLGMRRFPGLDQVEIEDLAKLLSATTERTVRKNTMLAKRGTPLGSAYFVIEGQLRVGLGWDGKGETTTLTLSSDERIRGANTIVGLVEMIAASPEGLDIECITADAVVLELEKADFLAFCADNFEMLAELLRTFSTRVLELSPFEGIGPATRTPKVVEKEKSDPNRFVDRLRLLYRMDALKPFGAEAISDLAVAMKEKRVTSPNEERCLVRAGRALDSIYVVLSGALQLGPARVEPGSVFGLLQAVSESPLTFDLIARPNTRLLTCRREVLSDLLEDNIAFTLAWLRQLTERILVRRRTSSSRGGT